MGPICFFPERSIRNYHYSLRNDPQEGSSYLLCRGSLKSRLEFSRQIFEKYSDIKFHENPSSGSRVVQCGRTDGRTDRHDEADSRFWQLRLKTTGRNFKVRPPRPPPLRQFTDVQKYIISEYVSIIPPVLHTYSSTVDNM